MNKTHILVVEDEYYIYEGIQAALLDEGYTVAEYAPSVTDAIKEINKQHPDLVLLDIDLQGELTGLDLGKKLHEEYHIPFIYISSLDDRRTFNQALETKHEIYMVKTKPFLDEKTLLRHIETVLNKDTAGQKTIPQSIGISVFTNYLEDLKNNGIDQISTVKIHFDDIVFISKDMFENASGQKETLRNNYVWIKVKDGQTYFLKRSLSNVETLLPHNFARVNVKYIINITSPDFKGQTTGNIIKLKDRNLRISRSYKEEFEKKMNFYFPTIK